jgi:hypothetical protein
MKNILSKPMLLAAGVLIGTFSFAQSGNGGGDRHDRNSRTSTNRESMEAIFRNHTNENRRNV